MKGSDGMAWAGGIGVIRVSSYLILFTLNHPMFQSSLSASDQPFRSKVVITTPLSTSALYFTCERDLAAAMLTQCLLVN